MFPTLWGRRDSSVLSVLEATVNIRHHQNPFLLRHSAFGLGVMVFISIDILKKGSCLSHSGQLNVKMKF